MGHNSNAYYAARESVVELLRTEGTKTTEELRAFLLAEYATAYGWLIRMKEEGLIQGSRRRRSAKGWEQRRWRIAPAVDSIR